MQTIALAGTGRTTSRLGFGGSSIMGGLNRRQSLAVLESAYDAGIRHFDTAPMYGSGEAEACLGEFLTRHPGSLTITTKFGIPPVPQRAVVRLVRAVAGPVLQQMPALKRRLQRGLQPGRPAAERARTANPIFNAAQAAQSLENSLRALRTDHIDLFLLHEVTALDLPAQAMDDTLLRLLEDAVASGKIGAFGIGSERDEIPALLAQHPRFCPVTQYEWSVLNPAVAPGPCFRIHHRALSERFHALTGLLSTDAACAQRWSAATGADLAEPGTLARLMLKASWLLNPASLLLFSSKSAHHIQQNVIHMDDPGLDAAALGLYKLFQAEPPPV